jgi:hypothetical protein
MGNSSSTSVEIFVHPPSLSKPSNQEKIVAEELIELIDFNEAPIYNHHKTLKYASKIKNGKGKKSIIVTLLDWIFKTRIQLKVF